MTGSVTSAVVQERSVTATVECGVCTRCSGVRRVFPVCHSVDVDQCTRSQTWTHTAEGGERVNMLGID